MNRFATIALTLVLVSTLVAGPEGYWPAWRGPNATGAAVKGDPPTTWSESQNIKWKVAVPGAGSSSPVIWADRIIFLTAELISPQAVAPTPLVMAAAGPRQGGGPGGRGGRGGGLSSAPAGKYRFSVVCLNRADGKLLWQTPVAEATPHQGHHPTGSFASYSPVTDGKNIWASFGSRGLHCLDMDGNLKWSKDMPPMNIVMGFGEGGSCALAGDHIIVVHDHEGDSAIYCFNKDTGDLAWRKPRDEPTSWATPLPVDVNGKTQIITAATGAIRAYDPADGQIIWQCSGLTRNVIPSPVTDGKLVYCTSGYRGSALLAIELGRTGDLTGTDAVKWQVNEATPYVPSPLLYQNRLYVFSVNRAVLSCYQADTGKPLFTQQAIEGLREVYASGVGAAGRIYLTGRDGACAVLKAADAYEPLALNKLDDAFDASPAVIDNEIYLKGKNLYCIAAP